MTSLEAEEMLLVYEGLVLGRKYREKICSRCIGTEQQKKRDCALFRGLDRPSCRNMGDSIRKKLKEKQKKLMQRAITELQAQKVSGINPELLGV